MAKYKVVSFTLAIVPNPSAYDYISLQCHLLNSAGNPAIRNYDIMTDTRFPNINYLYSIIESGFQYANATGANVEISEFKARVYLFITLPSANGKQQIQVTGRRV